jgi:hypothetical protein
MMILWRCDDRKGRRGLCSSSTHVQRCQETGGVSAREVGAGRPRSCSKCGRHEHEARGESAITPPVQRYANKNEGSW